MSKRFLLILAAIVVIFGGLLVINKRDADAPTDGASTAELSQHKTAEGSTGVTLIEYGDFQCSACAQYHPILQQLKEQYKGQVTFQFRHFPLTEIHQNALISSRAAEAASMQDKFWEMHDMLFENQKAWESSTNPTPIFEQYAETIGLDMEKFREDIKSPQTNDVIQADRAEAKKQNYQSTPTFILDGQKIDNPQSLEEFVKLIDDAIAAKQNQ